MTKAKTTAATTFAPAAKKAPAKKVIVGKKAPTKQVDTAKLDAALAAAQAPIVVTAPAKTTPSKKTVKQEMSKAPSKMELATEQYLANSTASRADLLKLFIEKAGLTKMGASTYLSLIKAKNK